MVFFGSFPRLLRSCSINYTPSSAKKNSAKNPHTIFSSTPVPSLLAAVADLVFPRTCVVCGGDLEAGEEHICAHCASDIPLTRYEGRECNPMADALNARIQERIVAEGGAYEPYSRACALFFYKADSPYSNISKALKYRYNRSAGRFFASMLGERMAASPLYADVDAVVPVPLHWMRRWRRGYNQAEVIAAAICAALPSAQLCPAMLRRRSRTRSQARLSSAAERSVNLRGAFKARPVSFCGQFPRHILLVDDVCTTGATLCECHRALRAAFGPRVRISVATLGFVI